MGRASDSREVLIAEALGDFQVLLERVDAVLPRLEAASDRMERASRSLTASFEALRQNVAHAIVGERDKALARIAAGASEAAVQAHQQQLDELRKSARALFREEVGPAMRDLGRSLRQLHATASRKPHSCRVHLAIVPVSAVASAICAVWLGSAVLPMGTPRAPSAVSAAASAVEPQAPGQRPGRGQGHAP